MFFCCESRSLIILGPSSSELQDWWWAGSQPLGWEKPKKAKGTKKLGQFSIWEMRKEQRTDWSQNTVASLYEFFVSPVSGTTSHSGGWGTLTRGREMITRIGNKAEIFLKTLLFFLRKYWIVLPLVGMKMIKCQSVCEEKTSQLSYTQHCAYRHALNDMGSQVDITLQQGVTRG